MYNIVFWSMQLDKKTISYDDNYPGRLPYRKTTSQENNLKQSLKDSLTNLQENRFG